MVGFIQGKNQLVSISMVEKPFEGFPDSFFAGLVIFIVPALILFTSQPFAPYQFPHPVVFYLSVFFTIAIITGLVGWGNLVEYLGFDLVQPGERIEQVWWRFPILLFFGFLVGFGLYKWSDYASSLLGLPMLSLPLDSALAVYFLSYPLIFSTVNWIIVAVFEEIMRNVGVFIFANALSKRFNLKADSAFVGGVILASISFIILHLPAWQFTGNIFPYIFGIGASMLFTLIGYVLYVKGLWGKLAFAEFSIIAPITAHFVFDQLIDMKLRMIPLFALIFKPF